MTKPPKRDDDLNSELPLLANHASMLAVRVRPAEFARMLGVSKQTVSRWVKEGKVTVNMVDGRIDVQRGVQDVLRNTQPGRMRSRVLLQAVDDVRALRFNLAEAVDRLAASEAAGRAAADNAAFWEAWAGEADRAFDVFFDLIVTRAETLRATPADEWAAVLDAWRLEADLVNEATDSSAGCDGDSSDFIAAVDARVLANKEGGGSGGPA